MWKMMNIQKGVGKGMGMGVMDTGQSGCNASHFKDYIMNLRLTWEFGSLFMVYYCSGKNGGVSLPYSTLQPDAF